MKTLYISDLDGTLLNKDAELSPYTRKALQELYERGIYFTVATARTFATTVKILEGLDFRVPVILMNGVFIYDITTKKILKQEILPETAVSAIIKILRQYHVDGFMYQIKGNLLTTCYETLEDPAMKAFYEKRTKKYYKSFLQVPSFESIEKNSIVYFTLQNLHDRLLPVYDAIKALNIVDVELYRDNYSENMWFLECFSKKASKYNAALYLREQYQFDHMIGFGDNLNDLSLFRACDESYAVSNAVTEVREAAAGVIGSHLEDSVVKWLIENVRS